MMTWNGFATAKCPASLRALRLSDGVGITPIPNGELAAPLVWEEVRG